MGRSGPFLLKSSPDGRTWSEQLLFLRSPQERAYKHTSVVAQLAVHFTLCGNLIVKDSDEGRRLSAKHSLTPGRFS